MNAAQDMALTLLIANHNAEQKAKEPIVTVVKPKKQVEPKAVGPIHRKPITTIMAGTINAKDFILAMRKTTDRNEQIKLIMAYVGYDSRQNFGPQEAAARLKATRELSGKPIQGLSREELRACNRNLRGVVAGLPDTAARKLADLKAREVAAVEAMIQHEKDGRDMARSDNDRMLSDGLASVERERLFQIRADIKALE